MVDEYIREYREQLKRELQDIIHCRASIQFKCMALLAIVSPDAYRFIKNQYRKYTHFIER